MTLQELEARLALYLAAEAKILEGQSYTIDTGSGRRQLQRADLAVVQAEIRRIRAEMTALRPRRTIAVGVPRG